jgi:hypothetical protein
MHRWIFIIKEHRFPGFTLVPSDVGGKHAKKDVAAHTFLSPVVDSADLQINGLEGTKGSLSAFHSSKRPLLRSSSLRAHWRG